MNPEILGLIATTIILISFLLDGERKIRLINIIGCILFVIYGVIIGAASVWVLNAGLIIIHIYKLLKMKKEGQGA